MRSSIEAASLRISANNIREADPLDGHSIEILAPGLAGAYTEQQEEIHFADGPDGQQARGEREHVRGQRRHGLSHRVQAWLTIAPIMSFAGLLMISTINVDTTILWILASPFVFGLGCVTSMVLTAVQNSAEPSEIGMPTSAVNMICNIGSTMGTAVFAAIINNGILTRLSDLCREPPLKSCSTCCRMIQG